MNQSDFWSSSAVVRRAWWRWGLLTGLSVAAMLLLLPAADVMQTQSSAWFIVPVLWLVFAVPATIGVYGRCFRDHFGAVSGGSSGGCSGGVSGAAAGADYLRGVTSVWAVLAMGVGLSLGACLLTGAASPAVWPGALMLMLLVLARPSASVTAE